jgi:hypothetical protein
VLAGAAASVVLWLLAEHVADARTANRAVLLFCFLPPAFVLSMVYSEALFFLLVGLCLLALVRERWLVAGVAAALAGLVRPTGLVLTLACAWAAVAAIRRHGSWRPAIAPLLAPAGTQPAAGLQRAPVRSVHRDARGHRGRRGLAVYLLVRWPLPAPVLVYVAGTAGIALLSSNITSLPRYLLAAFPVLIPVARQLSDDTYPIVLAATATLMATLFWTTSLVAWLAP